MKTCARCGGVLSSTMEIGRTSVCPDCGADLRTCLNCHFYQKGAHWDCRETISEAVRDKDKGNFCDWFRFKETSSSGRGGGKSSGNAKADFNKLFGL